jgi:threonine synthase
MQYRSTRGLSPEVDSAKAVLTGLAPDGGLYLPCDLPTFAWRDCIGKDTLGMAEMILSAFLPDIPVSLQRSPITAT